MKANRPLKTECPRTPSRPLTEVVDLLYDELKFAFGIANAFRGVQVVNDLQDTGLDELMEAHIARLTAVIEKVETIRTQ